MSLIMNRKLLLVCLVALKHYHLSLEKAFPHDFGLCFQLILDQIDSDFLILMEIVEVSFMADFADWCLLLPYCL